MSCFCFLLSQKCCMVMRLNPHINQCFVLTEYQILVQTPQQPCLMVQGTQPWSLIPKLACSCSLCLFSVSPSLCVSLSVSLPLSLCLSLSFSLCPSPVSLFPLSLSDCSLCVSLPFCLSLSPFLSCFLSLCLSLSVFLCLPPCLSLSVSLLLL